MELSEATLELLQDEAYAFLCRQVVQETLASIECEKAVIASTRPPFGVLARKETRDAFTRSMRTALDNEAALRDRLAQISGIEVWLRPLLRQDIAAYLAAVSPDFKRFQHVRARLDVWEVAFQALRELLVAFARELRNLREAVGSDPAAGGRLGHELSVVSEIAVRLEQQHRKLLVIGSAVAELTQAGAMSEIRAPALPDFQRVAWVSRLAALPLDQALTEATCFEKEVRDFLADGTDLVHARLEVNRDGCARLENKVLEQYWNQLRAHAQAHYVEERDVDDVLAMLAQRYGSAENARWEKEPLSDPYSTER
jgi:hypothetical protein